PGTDTIALPSRRVPVTCANLPHQAISAIVVTLYEPFLVIWVNLAQLLLRATVFCGLGTSARTPAARLRTFAPGPRCSPGARNQLSTGSGPTCTGPRPGPRCSRPAPS